MTWPSEWSDQPSPTKCQVKAKEEYCRSLTTQLPGSRPQALWVPTHTQQVVPYVRTYASAEIQSVYSTTPGWQGEKIKELQITYWNFFRGWRERKNWKWFLRNRIYQKNSKKNVVHNGFHRETQDEDFMECLISSPKSTVSCRNNPQMFLDKTVSWVSIS